jgi:hypothetical protein
MGYKTVETGQGKVVRLVHTAFQVQIPAALVRGICLPMVPFFLQNLLVGIPHDP